jgi:hypothetical protein
MCGRRGRLDEGAATQGIDGELRAEVRIGLHDDDVRRAVAIRIGHARRDVLEDMGRLGA